MKVYLSFYLNYWKNEVSGGRSKAASPGEKDMFSICVEEQDCSLFQ